MKTKIDKIQNKIVKIQTVKDLRNAVSDYSGDYTINFEMGNINDILSQKDRDNCDLEEETKNHVIRIVDYTEAIDHKALTIELFID